MWADFVGISILGAISALCLWFGLSALTDPAVWRYYETKQDAFITTLIGLCIGLTTFFMIIT